VAFSDCEESAIEAAGFEHSTDSEDEFGVEVPDEVEVPAAGGGAEAGQQKKVMYHMNFALQYLRLQGEDYPTSLVTKSGASISARPTSYPCSSDPFRCRSQSRVIYCITVLSD
jgi:hypothetical protein